MTEPLYQTDTYLFECLATVKRAQFEEGKLRVVLDRTIFYPQGGGQPTDVGCIRSVSGDKTMNVTFARLSPQTGEIEHEGGLTAGSPPEGEEGGFAVGEQVTLQIDKDRRLLNARLHSAGHLLDGALQLLEVPLVGIKGYHFPDGPYVEYVPRSDQEVDLAELLSRESQSRIELMASQMIAEARPITVYKAKPGDCAPKLYAALPEKARQSEEVRLIRFEGVPLDGPCGGTHLANTREIGKFGIRKVGQRKGVVKISYSIE